MKTDDRDERLASVLDEAVRDIAVKPTGAPASTISGIGRSVRSIAAAAAAAIFVAGVVFASGEFGRDVRSQDGREGTIVEGSLETDGWQLRRPSNWITAPFEGCGTTLPRGVIVSNVEFEFLNPDGQVPSCNERMVLAGFPSDGVAIDLEPSGARGLSRIRLMDTPFPLGLSQLLETGGIEGGPHESFNHVVVDGESTAGVRLWVGPEASSDDIATAHEILRSMRIEGADRWVDEVVESHGISVGLTRPEDWETDLFKGLMVVDAPDPIMLLTTPYGNDGATKVCGPLVIGAPRKLSPTGVAIVVSDASGSWITPEVGSKPDVLSAELATRARTIKCRTGRFLRLHFAFDVAGKPILVDVLMGSIAAEEPFSIAWVILESLDFPAEASPPQEPVELPSPASEFRSEFVSDERGYRVWPTSGQVESGVTYRFAVPHCGMDWLVDFDGSFWEPAYPSGDEPDYAINADIGTMTLVGPAEASYVASDASRVSLTRIAGPVVTHLCD